MTNSSTPSFTFARTYQEFEDGDFGFVLDVIDELFPLTTSEPSERPYGWEGNFSPSSAVENADWSFRSWDDPEPEEEPKEPTSGVGLSYWENQSGGQGWGWHLAFESWQELIDFLCVAYAGLGCHDESDYFESRNDPESEDERQTWAVRPNVAELWQQRPGCIAALAAGVPPKKAFGPFLQALHRLVSGRVSWVGEYSSAS